MIRVVLVDDQPMIRIALRGILESSNQIQVVAEADRGQTGIVEIRAHRPDVVLLDLRMPGMDGIETIRELRRDPGLSNVRILVLTTFENDENVIAAVRAGADGFLGKGSEPQELIEGVVTVSGGGALLSSSATRSLLNHVSTGESATPASSPLSSPDQVASLTVRERDILELVGRGQDNDGIAETLFISPFTVKTHISRAMQKLGVNTRAQLVRVAIDYRITN